MKRYDWGNGWHTIQTANGEEMSYLVEDGVIKRGTKTIRGAMGTSTEVAVYPYKSTKNGLESTTIYANKHDFESVVWR